MMCKRCHKVGHIRGNRGFSSITIFLAVLAILTFSGSCLFAAEGGGSAYFGGNEDFMSGALPPPGQYVISYNFYRSSNKIADNAGYRVPGAQNVPVSVDTKVQVLGDAMRLIYVTKYKFLGASVGWHVIVPVVNAHVSLDTAGLTRGTKTGLGDIEFSPLVLGWHFKNFHMIGAVDIMVPTGAYDKDDFVNIGRNYWTFNPIFAWTFLSDSGFEVSSKMLYLINTTNTATSYTSGQEFIADYAIGQHVGNWLFGISGYFYKQITEDSAPSTTADLNGRTGAYFDGMKGQNLAIGPALQYNYKNMFFNLKFQVDTLTKNRTEGTTAWFKFMYAF
jgi:hypothetical protein